VVVGIPAYGEPLFVGRERIRIPVVLEAAMDKGKQFF